MKTVFSNLVNLPNSPRPLEFTSGGHLKFRDKSYPWSIVEKEFNFLYDQIVDNQLQTGFEACTGIGISGLAAGLAMKETGGKVVTIDAYIEEHLENSNYPDHRPLVINDSHGYQHINYLIDQFNLTDNLIAAVGWSPDDVPALIEKHFTQSLDYVFIDGGHFDHQVIRDIECLLPYTDSSTHWLFHDVNPPCWTQTVYDYCRRHLNKSMQIVLPASQGCNNLGILVDIK